MIRDIWSTCNTKMSYKHIGQMCDTDNLTSKPKVCHCSIFSRLAIDIHCPNKNSTENIALFESLLTAVAIKIASLLSRLWISYLWVMTINSFTNQSDDLKAWRPAMTMTLHWPVHDHELVNILQSILLNNIFTHELNELFLFDKCFTHSICNLKQFCVKPLMANWGIKILIQ